MTTPYIPRIADKLLHQQLEASGGVLIQGPKWCGKTTTAQQQAKSALYMDDPKTRGANLLLAETDPEILFKGETPRLIDEWQLAPKLWDAARFEISRRRLPGQFIFTGSSVPPDMSEITHSGTGRFAWVTMRTMSFLRQATNYVDAVVRSDISRVDNVSRDAAFARRLLRSYARHQGQQDAGMEPKP